MIAFEICIAGLTNSAAPITDVVDLVYVAFFL